METIFQAVVTVSMWLFGVIGACFCVYLGFYFASAGWYRAHLAHVKELSKSFTQATAECSERIANIVKEANESHDRLVDAKDALESCQCKRKLN